MFIIRRSGERGHVNHGWLDAYHTFSFASYHDPDHMGFRSLRVINEDTVAPGEGFDTHPHKDMEILTYIISGELAHRDSMGNGRTIKAGEVQGMSAGTGITHSEFNASDKTPVHLLQTWILPHTKHITPAYGEWYPGGKEKQGWALAASEDGAGGSIRIHQDARLYVSVSDTAHTLALPIAPERFGWLQVATGSADLAGERLAAGDGAAFSGNAVKEILTSKNTSLLFFDMA